MDNKLNVLDLIKIFWISERGYLGKKKWGRDW